MKVCMMMQESKFSSLPWLQSGGGTVVNIPSISILPAKMSKP